MTDSEMMVLIKTEPEKGLSLLSDTYSRLVYACVSRKLSRLLPREDIEETVSDVLFEFYTERDRIDTDKTPIKACLLTLATRRASDRYRRCAVRKEDFFSEGDEEKLTDESTPEDDICEGEESAETLKAVKALGMPDAAIVIRRYWMEQKICDIAKALSMSPNAVTKRLKKCHEKLSKVLNGGNV